MVPLAILFPQRLRKIISNPFLARFLLIALLCGLPDILLSPLFAFSPPSNTVSAYCGGVPVPRMLKEGIPFYLPVSARTLPPAVLAE